MAETFRDAYAVVIGVGGDLPVTAADAKAIAKILCDPTRCAIPDENVRVLTEWEATRAGIIDALQALAAEAGSNDVVTLYFSGHGNMLPAAPERRFLVPRDGNWLDGEQFTGLLEDIPAQRLLVLLDCCYAGGVHRERGAKAPEAKSVPVPFDVQQLRRQGAGTVVLSSSRADELSWTGTHYSIFTQVVIDALCGVGAAHRDGYVRVTDLAMHVAQWVPAMTDDKQHPQLHLKAADNYPVAYYAAGSKTALGKPRWFAEATAEPAPVIRQPATGPSEPERSLPSAADAIRKLRDLFVAANLTEGEAKRIARDSGVDAQAIWWTSDPTSFWETVLDRAHTAWRMEYLFAAADPVFGDNPAWTDAKRNYLTARARLSVEDAIRKLRDLFVAANLTEGEAKRIARDSGVDAQAVWWTSDPTSFWETVLDRAHTAWRMEYLFAAADPLFGDNPAWTDAKRNYLTACGPAPPSEEEGKEEVAPVDLAFHRRRLRMLANALGHVLPSIFRDPRIRVARLDAASNALLSVDPVIKALSAAAERETQQPLRHKLQRLDGLLQRRYEAVARELSVLDKIRSEGAAVKPCEKLAKETTGLLIAYEQAIGFVT